MTIKTLTDFFMLLPSIMRKLGREARTFSMLYVNVSCNLVIGLQIEIGQHKPARSLPGSRVGFARFIMPRQCSPDECQTDCLKPFLEKSLRQASTASAS
jgi:hypothetical protein